MNELQNIDAAAIAAQLTEGTAEVVEMKSTGTKGKLITGGIALGGMVGTGILGFLLGKKHEKKKWESYDEDEDFDDFEDVDDEEDYVEYVETEPETSTEQPKETDKAEK